MGGDAAAFRYFHLGKARAAASAPRHHVVTTVDEALFVALLEKCPNGVIVLVEKSEVAAAKFRGAKFADDFAGARSLRVTARELRSNDAITIRERVAQREQQ